jgi:hypothetical protein
MITVIAADTGVLAGILWHDSPLAGAQLHGDERAIERFLQRAFDPPGDSSIVLANSMTASSAPSSPQPATHGTVSPLTSSK